MPAASPLPKLSIGLHPRAEIVRYAKLAEELGYDRCWSFDSPAMYGDVFIALARVAEQTERIKLGTAVLVPSNRHVLATASAIASIEELAPGRLAIAMGTGYSARYMLGQPPIRWSEMEDFTRNLRALLAGETTVVDGRKLRMCHPEALAPKRPIRTPLLLAADGPKGLGIAKALGDGVIAGGGPKEGFDWSCQLVYGTVLDEGEDFETPRVFDAIGPALAVMYHGAYQMNPDAVEGLPGGKDWRSALEQIPEDERHFSAHEGHCFELSRFDRGNVSPELGPATFSGSESELRERMKQLAAGGCSEMVYMPLGPDLEREMHAMARVAELPGA